MKKVVGVKIDTKSEKTKDKIYYYSTDKDFKRGDRVRATMPSGGTPITTVVIQNSKKKSAEDLKKLEI